MGLDWELLKWDFMCREQGFLLVLFAPKKSCGIVFFILCLPVSSDFFLENLPLTNHLFFPLSRQQFPAEWSRKLSQLSPPWSPATLIRKLNYFCFIENKRLLSQSRQSRLPTLYSGGWFCNSSFLTSMQLLLARWYKFPNFCTIFSRYFPELNDIYQKILWCYMINVLKLKVTKVKKLNFFVWLYCCYFR